MPSSRKVCWGIYGTPHGVLTVRPSPVSNRNIGSMVFLYGTLGKHYSADEALNEYDLYKRGLVKDPRDKTSDIG